MTTFETPAAAAEHRGGPCRARTRPAVAARPPVAVRRVPRRGRGVGRLLDSTARGPRARPVARRRCNWRAPTAAAASRSSASSSRSRRAGPDPRLRLEGGLRLRRLLAEAGRADALPVFLAHCGFEPRRRTRPPRRPAACPPRCARACPTAGGWPRCCTGSPRTATSPTTRPTGSACPSRAAWPSARSRPTGSDGGRRARRSGRVPTTRRPGTSTASSTPSRRGVTLPGAARRARLDRRAAGLVGVRRRRRRRAARRPRAARSRSARSVPAPARFGGMPAPRFWEMEDARFDPGAIDASRIDLGRLLLVDFATVYGNDWLVAPVRLPVGSLSRMTTFAVTDVFGRTDELGPAGAADDGWNLFGAHRGGRRARRRAGSARRPLVPVSRPRSRTRWRARRRRACCCCATRWRTWRGRSRRSSPTTRRGPLDRFSNGPRADAPAARRPRGAALPRSTPTCPTTGCRSRPSSSPTWSPCACASCRSRAATTASSADRPAAGRRAGPGRPRGLALRGGGPAGRRGRARAPTSTRARTTAPRTCGRRGGSAPAAARGPAGCGSTRSTRAGLPVRSAPRSRPPASAASRSETGRRAAPARPAAG